MRSPQNAAAKITLSAWNSSTGVPPTYGGDKEVVELIQTCTELGVEPFKSFTLERRTSEKTGAEYIAVVLKMFNDDEYFYFLPRATNTIVELLIAKAAQDESAANGKKA